MSPDSSDRNIRSGYPIRIRPRNPTDRQTDERTQIPITTIDISLLSDAHARIQDVQIVQRHPDGITHVRTALAAVRGGRAEEEK